MTRSNIERIERNRRRIDRLSVGVTYLTLTSPGSDWRQASVDRHLWCGTLRTTSQVAICMKAFGFDQAELEVLDRTSRTSLGFVIRGRLKCELIDMCRDREIELPETFIGLVIAALHPESQEAFAVEVMLTSLGLSQVF